MNFEFAIKTMNSLLAEKRPETFGRAWVRVNAPYVYHFIQRKIRIKNGGIDWDRITRSLSPQFQKKWMGSLRRKAKPYWDKGEVNIVLRQYKDKLYTFITTEDSIDEHIRDVISIELVRIAQRGNMSAKREITRLLKFTIDDWIEKNKMLSCWTGYDELIQARLECCIRCYRYSGSFMRYLFKTLEYAGRGLRPIFAHSLDDCAHRRTV
jgi:hypothetical protein